jgi:hypothetical protein
MPAAAPGTRASRLAWFLGLWLASVAALGLVAWAIRWAIHP